MRDRVCVLSHAVYKERMSAQLQFVFPCWDVSQLRKIYRNSVIPI